MFGDHMHHLTILKGGGRGGGLLTFEFLFFAHPIII